MFYTAVFLGGEWGKTDFTPCGKGARARISSAAPCLPAVLHECAAVYVWRVDGLLCLALLSAAATCAVVCMVFLVAGIALFSLPIGTLFESFDTFLRKKKDISDTDAGDHADGGADEGDEL